MGGRCPPKRYLMKLYEQPELRELTGPTLRPGGLELTRLGVELCGWQAGQRVLDLGCGPGETLGLLCELGIQGIGLDISRQLLGEAAGRAPAAMADLMKLPLRDAALDGALCECVLSLMPDKTAMLRGLRRAMRPGARLLLTDLVLRKEPEQATCCTFKTNVSSCIDGAETPQNLREIIETAGFAIIHESDETRALKELAVNMVFRYGSSVAFFRQWSGAKEKEVCECSNSAAAKNLGYIMLVAEAVLTTQAWRNDR